MRLFICYARDDKASCNQLVKRIDTHDLWYDDALVAGEDWWQMILQQIDACDCFIYLLSPKSVASFHCRREFDVAVRLNKQIIPLKISKDLTEIPAFLANIQVGNLSNGITETSYHDVVLQALFNAENRLRDQRTKRISALNAVDRQYPEVPTDRHQYIGLVTECMNNDRLDDARVLLQTGIERGYQNQFRTVSLTNLLEKVNNELREKEKHAELEEEYRDIVILVRGGTITFSEGCQAFREFRRRNPQFEDTEKIGTLCGDSKEDNETEIPNIGDPFLFSDSKPLLYPPSKRLELPFLEWCPIEPSASVSAFMMSKYPVTNELFMLFWTDKNGYRQSKWWEYSVFAQDWFEKMPKARAPHWAHKERPRERVSWFEAMAFTFWLSDYLGRKVSLPSQAQWRRSAQGDDKRIYPWGDVFDKGKCNTRDSNFFITTPVMRYPDGKSPFGVMDLSGNVWEWCLNSPDNLNALDITTASKRIIMGGSWATRPHHARIDYSYAVHCETFNNAIGFRVAMSLP